MMIGPNSIILLEMVLWMVAITTFISTFKVSISSASDHNNAQLSSSYTTHQHTSAGRQSNLGSQQVAPINGKVQRHRQQQQQRPATAKLTPKRHHRNQTQTQPDATKLPANASSTTYRPTYNNASKPPTGGQQIQDPFALAQQQARLMMGYNNTPPLFVTDTRDFFVDVARQPLGTTIRTIRAMDMDGDPLEYSLKPANLHDASPYFAINPATGEIKLANRPFKFCSNPTLLALAQSKREPKTRDDTADDAADDNDREVLEGGGENDKEAEGYDEEADADANRSGSQASMCQPEDEEEAMRMGPSDGWDRGLVSRNVYFLNVAVDDGSYTSVVEFQIHVVNSSSLATTAGSLPVQLTPEGSRKAAMMMSDRLEGLVLRKTEEFYNKLHRPPTQQSSTTNNNNNNSSQPPIVVYPNFVNPGLVRPASEQQPVPPSGGETRSPPSPATKQPVEEPTAMLKQPSQDLSGFPPLINSMLTATAKDAPSTGEFGLHDRQQLQNDPLAPPVPQPMLVSLVVACSCLMICLVLLMFIVPLSVKRLRKRLKHVEHVQHEHLSQQTSNGSSTVCSSSASTASSTRDHMPSLSQFSLSLARSSAGNGGGGSGSSVCRQSSLDSAKVSTMSQPPLFGLECSRPLNRINNGSIANPVYLQQHHHLMPPATQHNLNNLHHHNHLGPQIIQNQAFLLTGSAASRCQLPNSSHHPATAQRCDNVYYPIDDDDFYSTINTGSTILNQGTGVIEGETISTDNDQIRDDTNNNANYFLTAQERPIESRNSDSGSSTRSLARFLSLPARHSSHNHQAQVQSATDELKDALEICPVEQIFRQVTSKTIARASQIERDQKQQQRRDWELDRHRLKFLDILDAGQFGQVWRCNLKQKTGGGDDMIVAVKTLKNGAVKDERGREELLAEIEIMKLVCNHPNVVKILHCCTTNDSLFGGAAAAADGGGKPILLVMEYVEMGKLQSYLENSRVNHNYATSQQQYNDNQPACQQSTSDRLTSRDLIKFIYHVAKGMEYISSQWIVHRDLASRNILVNSQRICKIGDFGMARHMQSFCGIYERHSRNTKIPVRWMAPEVLLENRFTTKSDVYSFGILMWEIVTLGSTPYRHLKTEQVIEEVARNGERPTKPEYCHAQLYKIMTKCWLHEPDQRPTFGGLVRQLDDLLLSANDYIELDQYPDHNYYNIPETAAPNELL